MVHVVTVGLGERAYGIHVGDGLLDRAPALLKPFARGLVPVVTDSTVGEIHLARFLDFMDKAGLDARPIVMPPGEPSKSFAGLELLCGQLLETGIERSGLIVAFGGGVIGDLAGFAAGILKRGIAFAQIPTTLLAQVDSSVGGKTAINVKQGKNLVGLFYQPRLVVADTRLLTTLSARQLRAGYAEVVKYGVLGDAQFFAWLEQNGPLALAGDHAAMVHLVAHSCRMKAAIVARDEQDRGERTLLNLGHTFGHALEAETGFGERLLHGEAVAIGMVLALRLSVRLGLAPESDADRLATHLKAAGLPCTLADIPGPPLAPEKLIGHMAHDKKSQDGKLVFVLLRGLGQAFASADVPPEALRAVLEE